MLSNKNKRGAMALFMVFLIPVILMVFSVMLDGILAKNIKNATQRYLDSSTLLVANLARENACWIADADIDEGIALMNKNVANSGLAIEYSLMPMRSATKDEQGIVTFIITGKITRLNGRMFIPFNYVYRFTLESRAVCTVTI